MARTVYCHGRFIPESEADIPMLLDRAGIAELPDIARRRQAWFDSQPELDPAKLVFTNETGLYENGPPA